MPPPKALRGTTKNPRPAQFPTLTAQHTGPHVQRQAPIANNYGVHTPTRKPLRHRYTAQSHAPVPSPLLLPRAGEQILAWAWDRWCHSIGAWGWVGPTRVGVWADWTCMLRYARTLPCTHLVHWPSPTVGEVAHQQGQLARQALTAWGHWEEEDGGTVHSPHMGTPWPAGDTGRGQVHLWGLALHPCTGQMTGP